MLSGRLVYLELGWTGLWLLGLGILGAAFSVATGLYGAEG
jgi:hypothetical protein